MKPYTNNLDQLSYFANDHELTDGGQHPIQRGDFLLSELVNFTTVDEHHANITILLRVRTSIFSNINKIEVICSALLGNDEFNSLSTLYLAGSVK